ncbi:MAG TPA: mycofactocin biosynthesis chaperone MftB [Acidimicrobiales bacterium]|nr:mycofactocin biosynthesis chaperone MftB [Acidimicrobiales bacterium]
MGCAASTETGFDPARPYELHPDVALRSEPFGALAYHYGNRRLTFLRSPELVRLVGELGSHASVTESMAALGIAASRRPSLVRALALLAGGDVVRPRARAEAEAEAKAADAHGR